jgi:altronate dehydratase small subunit
MKRLALVANPEDNVATAIRSLKKGIRVLVERRKKGLKLILKEDIPFLHKFSIKKIDKGEDIIKYGEVIGKSLTQIKVGEHVHIHNIKSMREKNNEDNGL